MPHSTRRRRRRNRVLSFRPEPESEASWRARLARIRETQAIGTNLQVLRAAGRPEAYSEAEWFAKEKS